MGGERAVRRLNPRKSDTALPVGRPRIAGSLPESRFGDHWPSIARNRVLRDRMGSGFPSASCIVYDPCVGAGNVAASTARVSRQALAVSDDGVLTSWFRQLDRALTLACDHGPPARGSRHRLVLRQLHLEAVRKARGADRRHRGRIYVPT